jgi:uncharacterized membrane protein
VSRRRDIGTVLALSVIGLALFVSTFVVFFVVVFAGGVGR